MINKKRYIIQDREAGNMIEECESLEKAQILIKKYEDEDKKEGNFKDEFYEIVEK